MYTIAKEPEKLENGHYEITAEMVEEIRRQVLADDVKAVLDSFAYGAEGYDGSEIAKAIVSDNGYLASFVTSLEDCLPIGARPWSYADLVLLLDEDLHNYSYSPSAENILREELICFAKANELPFAVEDNE